MRTLSERRGRPGTWLVALLATASLAAPLGASPTPTPGALGTPAAVPTLDVRPLGQVAPTDKKSAAPSLSVSPYG